MGRHWPSFRLRASDAVRLVVSCVICALALWMAAAILPGLTVTEPWGYLAVAAVSGVIGLMIRPVLVEVSAWAIGPDGRRDLRIGEVVGADPLAAFGEHARRVLLRALLMREAPDLYVNSSVGALTGDVAAFGDLVGAHGGLGGFQDSAVLLVPRELAEGLPEHIEGADELHKGLVEILRRCGHRDGTPAAGPPPVPPPHTQPVPAKGGGDG